MSSRSEPVATTDPPTAAAADVAATVPAAEDIANANVPSSSGKKELSSSTLSPSSSSSSLKKTIYLIRHAESEENRRIASFKNVLHSVGKFSLPKSSDFSTSFQLCNMSVNQDSDVSDIGEQQISHVGELLRRDNFVQEKQIHVVVHSPLFRAKKTCEGLLGCAAPDKKAPTVKRVAELDCLLEKTPQEQWIPTPSARKSFLHRIETFQKWIMDQPEDKIAVVGHSQYFQAMLGLAYKFDNCEVYEVQFSPELALDKSNNDGKASSAKHPETTTTNQDAVHQVLAPWSNLKKLYGCEIKR